MNIDILVLTDDSFQSVKHLYLARMNIKGNYPKFCCLYSVMIGCLKTFGKAYFSFDHFKFDAFVLNRGYYNIF